MPYLKQEKKFTNGEIKVKKYYAVRYQHKSDRSGNVKRTSLEQAEINYRRSAEKRDDLLRENFDNASFITLTYLSQTRPVSFDDAHKTLTKFMSILMRSYNLNKDLKYMAKTETTVRGIHHHHIIIQGGAKKVKHDDYQIYKDDKIIRVVSYEKRKEQQKYIKKNKLTGVRKKYISIEPLTDADIIRLWDKCAGNDVPSSRKCREVYDIAGLADYINKRQAIAWDKEGNATEHLPQKFIRSRSLKMPKITVKKISAKTWRREPKPLAGYEIVGEVYNGFDSFGFEKQTYKMRKRC